MVAVLLYLLVSRIRRMNWKKLYGNRIFCSPGESLINNQNKKGMLKTFKRVSTKSQTI